jgi:hypothetical protein
MKKIALACIIAHLGAFCMDQESMNPRLKEYRENREKLCEYGEAAIEIIRKLDSPAPYIIPSEEKGSFYNYMNTVKTLYVDYIDLFLEDHQDEEDVEFFCDSAVGIISLLLHNKVFSQIDGSYQHIFLSTVDSFLATPGVRKILLNRKNYESERSDAAEYDCKLCSPVDFAKTLEPHENGYANIKNFVIELKKI